jgi:hypothetical protein
MRETRAVIEKELDRIAALDQREVRTNARGLNYGVRDHPRVPRGVRIPDRERTWVEGTTLGVIFIIGLVAVIAFGRRR